MTTLRPGQLTINELEEAVLFRLADRVPTLRAFIASLRVLSREYTGVGGYTRFHSDATDQQLSDQQLGLEGLIRLPTVPSGMGAVLFCEVGKPTLLELFTYGEETWDGRYDGFSIETSQKRTNNEGSPTSGSSEPSQSSGR